MILISYDISDDKLRTRFSKYIRKFGYRLQYSVYEINNSEKILANITAEIRDKFEPLFLQTDSVIIFILSKTCQVVRMGYAKNDESEFIIV